MQTPPTVTVLLLCYNTANYVERALSSILAQTLSDIEIIAIDDASDDSTLTKLKSFNDPRLKILSLPSNQGVSAVVNLGLQMAKGKYFAPLASDDYWLPEKLTKQIQFLVAKKLDIVANWTREESELNPNISKEVIHRFKIESTPLHFFLVNPEIGLGSSLLGVRSKLVLSMNENLKTNEDWELLVRLASGGIKFDILPEVLTLCTRRKAGLSKTGSNVDQARKAISGLQDLVSSGEISHRDLSLCYLRSATWMLNPENPKLWDALQLSINSAQVYFRICFSKNFFKWTRKFIFQLILVGKKYS